MRIRILDVQMLSVQMLSVQTRDARIPKSIEKARMQILPLEALKSLKADQISDYELVPDQIWWLNAKRDPVAVSRFEMVARWNADSGILALHNAPDTPNIDIEGLPFDHAQQFVLDCAKDTGAVRFVLFTPDGAFLRVLDYALVTEPERRAYSENLDRRFYQFMQGMVNQFVDAMAGIQKNQLHTPEHIRLVQAFQGDVERLREIAGENGMDLLGAMITKLGVPKEHARDHLLLLQLLYRDD